MSEQVDRDFVLKLALRLDRALDRQDEQAKGVEDLTSLRRTTVWRLESKSPRGVAWSEAEIVEWLHPRQRVNGKGT